MALRKKTKSVASLRNANFSINDMEYGELLQHLNMILVRVILSYVNNIKTKVLPRIYLYIVEEHNQRHLMKSTG